MYAVGVNEPLIRSDDRTDKKKITSCYRCFFDGYVDRQQGKEDEREDHANARTHRRQRGDFRTARRTSAMTAAERRLLAKRLPRCSEGRVAHQR